MQNIDNINKICTIFSAYFNLCSFKSFLQVDNTIDIFRDMIVQFSFLNSTLLFNVTVLYFMEYMSNVPCKKLHYLQREHIYFKTIRSDLKYPNM